ncbi:hypothetical protein ACHFCA_27770 [Delftia tsuruhatensis]
MDTDTCMACACARTEGRRVPGRQVRAAMRDWISSITAWMRVPLRMAALSL